MEKTIQIAKCTLADYFKISLNEFEKGKSRKRNIIEAKRFLIYFMVHELGIKFLHCSTYLPSLTHHATAMHHYYRMKEILEIEKTTRQRYANFKRLMMNRGMDKLEKELITQLEVRNDLNINIKKLEKMINEA